MFSFQPRAKQTYQTQGRDLASLLKLKQDALSGVVGEVDEYGKRKRGEEIMEQIAGMTPEQKKTADFMALGGKGSQSEQTMQILKDLAGQQEKEVGRDFTAGESEKSRTFTSEENRKNREGAQVLAKLKDKLGRGTPLTAEEKTKVNDQLVNIDTTLAQYAAQLKSATDRDRPYIQAQVEKLWRDKTELEQKLNPKVGAGILTEGYKNVRPGQREQAKMYPTENQKVKKKETNIFGF